MKPTLLKIAAFALLTAVARQNLSAATSAPSPTVSNATPSSVSSLRVAVDPRVELLSLVFRLAGNP